MCRRFKGGERVLTVKIKLGSFFNIENVESTIEVAGESIKLAEFIRENQAELGSYSLLVDTANRFLRISENSEVELAIQCAEAIVPFLKIAGGLVKYVAEKNTPDTSTFTKCVVLVCFRAYLSSVCEFSKTIPVSKSKAKVATVKDIQDVEITEREAKRTLARFAQSNLATEFRSIMALRLGQMGLDDYTINLLLTKALWATADKVTDFWGELPEGIRKFNADSISEFEAKQKNIEGIEEYLTCVNEEIDKIKPLPGQNRVKLRDLYVPLKVQEILDKGYINDSTNSLSIHEWIEGILLSEKREKLILIEGSSGQGKTAFCKMLFCFTKSKLYPAFIPVIVNLKSIDVIATTLVDTFKPCLQKYSFFSSNSDWLNSRDRRFLIILDGLDELLPSSGHVDEFIDQIIGFQESGHHQFLVTGRSLYADHFKQNSDHAQSVKGARILLMDKGLQQQWIDKWSAAVGNDRSLALREDFQDFIRSCPKDIERELAGEPLSLSLLAKLFKEGEISSQDLIDSGNVLDRMKIYQKALDTTVERISKGKTFKKLQNSKGLRENHLIAFLMTVSTCYVHTGYKRVLLSEIARILEGKHPFGELLKDESNDKQSLKWLVEPFYTSINEQNGAYFIEFMHRSFGEYLFARRVNEILSEWINGSFSRVSDDVYFTLGRRNITTQIVDHVMANLTKDMSHQSIEKLLTELQQFYIDWARGHSLQRYIVMFSETEGSITNNDSQGIRFRRVDTYVGFNILIVLLALYRHAKSNRLLKSLPALHLCGGTDKLSAENRGNLLRIFGYSYCLNNDDRDMSVDENFTDIVGKFLSEADFSHADLQGVNLNGADLRKVIFSGSNLSRASLVGADLRSAKMDGTNLTGADLRKAQIDRTVLRGAILTAANLSDLDLSKPNTKKTEDEVIDNLSCAILDRAVLTNAQLRGAILNGATLTNLNLSFFDLRDVDLRDANLSNTNLSNANLQYAIFTSQKEAFVEEENEEEDVIIENDEDFRFDNTNFNHAYLEGADFEGVDLTGVDFSDAILRRANFRGAILYETNLKGTDLSGAILEGLLLNGTDLRNANLQGAYLYRTVFKNTHLEGASLKGANLRGANLKDAQLYETIIEDVQSDPDTLWPQCDISIYSTDIIGNSADIDLC
jgi:uncharacterized protein YjbI with pentapeptide repeats